MFEPAEPVPIQGFINSIEAMRDPDYPGWLKGTVEVYCPIPETNRYERQALKLFSRIDKGAALLNLLKTAIEPVYVAGGPLRPPPLVEFMIDPNELYIVSAKLVEGGTSED